MLVHPPSGGEQKQRGCPQSPARTRSQSQPPRPPPPPRLSPQGSSSAQLHSGPVFPFRRGLTSGLEPMLWQEEGRAPVFPQKETSALQILGWQILYSPRIREAFPLSHTWDTSLSLWSVPLASLVSPLPSLSSLTVLCGFPGTCLRRRFFAFGCRKLLSHRPFQYLSSLSFPYPSGNPIRNLLAFSFSPLCLSHLSSIFYLSLSFWITALELFPTPLMLLSAVFNPRLSPSHQILYLQLLLHLPVPEGLVRTSPNLSFFFFPFGLVFCIYILSPFFHFSEHSKTVLDFISDSSSISSIWISDSRGHFLLICHPHSLSLRMFSVFCVCGLI